MDPLDEILERAVGRDQKRTSKADAAEIARARSAVQPPPEDDLETEPSGKFELELSDFTFLRNIRFPPGLRFTCTWKFDHPRYGLLGVSEEGWICVRNSRGDLSVAPPTTKFGPMQSKQLKVITAEFHNLLLAMLSNNRTKAGESYAGCVGKEYLEELKARQIDYDPELPKEIKA